MNSTVSIIMYHYVRDDKRTRYPDIKGITTENFREQVQYFKKWYHVISGYELQDALATGSDLPPRSLLLTFDDGYMDHFTNVFPILDEYGLPGCFFPAGSNILEHRILNVNKIHFLLASIKNPQLITQRMFEEILEHTERFALKTPEEYQRTVDSKTRWDTPEIGFIKRMLQRELPEEFRNLLIDKLFQEYVTSDEAAFSRELYMNPDQVRCLQRNNMYIGNHGYEHNWLNRLSAEDQKTEIERGLEFLSTIGMPTDRWLMNYPYGGFDQKVTDYLRTTQCVGGLSCMVDIADLHRDDPMSLPRLNTNDLPVEANAPKNKWTLQAR